MKLKLGNNFFTRFIVHGRCYRSVCIKKCHFSSPETKAHMIGLEPTSVRTSVRSHFQTLISLRPVNIFFLKHHCNPIGNTAVGFDQIGSYIWFPWQQIAPVGLFGKTRPPETKTDTELSCQFALIPKRNSKAISVD